jgi:hypothetical protein
MAMKCARCQDTYWVCEAPSDKDHPPRPPSGFQRDESLDDD